MADISATDLIRQWREGDREALDRLVPLVYDELRRMANGHLRREPGGQTIEPTALVHEAYMRLVAGREPDCNNRAHFLGIAARLMREILVDRARAKHARKRSAGERVPLDEDTLMVGGRASLLVALDDALHALERQDPEKARILELKYFSGMVAEETAQLLDIPIHRVNRQMRLAQAWLRRELGSTHFSPADAPDSSSDHA